MPSPLRQRLQLSASSRPPAGAERVFTTTEIIGGLLAPE
jgi:hypothetical protein